MAVQLGGSLLQMTADFVRALLCPVQNGILSCYPSIFAVLLWFLAPCGASNSCVGSSNHRNRVIIMQC